MRIRNLSWLAASLTLDFALLAFPVAVHADTYQFFNIGDVTGHQDPPCSGFGECIVHGDTYQFFGVGDLQIEHFYGLATDGTVVLQDEHGLYETVVFGHVTALEPTPPSLIYDNGTPCTPTDLPPGICNNGREVFQNNGGLYIGPDPVNDLIAPFQFRPPFAINSSGDIVFIYGEESIREAYDVTGHVPEPSTLVLLATGVLGAAGALRRRFVAGGGNGGIAISWRSQTNCTKNGGFDQLRLGLPGAIPKLAEIATSPETLWWSSPGQSPGTQGYWSSLRFSDEETV